MYATITVQKSPPKIGLRCTLTERPLNIIDHKKWGAVSSPLGKKTMAHIENSMKLKNAFMREIQSLLTKVDDGKCVHES